MTDQEKELFDSWKLDNKPQRAVNTKRVMTILVGISILANIAQMIWRAPKIWLVITWAILIVIVVCLHRLEKLKDELINKDSIDYSHIETFKIVRRVQKNVFATENGMYIKVGNIYNGISRDDIQEGKLIIGIRTYANTYDIVYVE